MTRRRPPPPAPEQDGVRVQKALADAGLGSRREIEGWIREGRVRINGKPARLGDRILAADHIRVDGKEVKRQSRRNTELQVIAYNKPEGELVTRSDPEGRPTVFERLPRPKSGRWIAIGRLDINTSGLLLLTNNGELANRLMHPSRAVEREYAVRILGDIPDDALFRLTHGLELEDGPARFEDIVESGGEGVNRWFHVLLCEGRNREVRRLWEAAGCRVSRLMRVRFGNVALGRRLFAGHWRKLTDDELADLFVIAGMEKPRLPSRRVGARKRPDRDRGRGRGRGRGSKADNPPAKKTRAAVPKRRRSAQSPD